MRVVRNFSTLTNLESLSIGGNIGVQGKRLAYLSSLTKLAKLDLGRCPIGDEEIRTVVNNFPKLRKLNLSECRGITYEAIIHLTHLTSLACLVLVRVRFLLPQFASQLPSSIIANLEMKKLHWKI